MRLDTAAGAAANSNPDPSVSVYSFQHAAAAAALQRSAFHHPFAASLPLSLHHCALAAVHKQALLLRAAGTQQLLVVHKPALALIPGVLQELCALWPLFEEQLLDQRPLPVSDKECTTGMLGVLIADRWQLAACMAHGFCNLLVLRANRVQVQRTEEVVVIVRRHRTGEVRRWQPAVGPQDSTKRFQVWTPSTRLFRLQEACSLEGGTRITCPPACINQGK